ncbi:MAG TPA: response regulator [Terracidiphilus sp.]|jgi:DNA-binding NtrC family response regulator
MPNTKTPHRIFVVDDNYAIASSLVSILRYKGFEDVSYFTDPQKALEAVKAKPPDLLITDVVMLPLTGLELAMKMHETCPECKIILFSGSPSSSQLLEIARDEGYHFEILAKPIHPIELLAKIHLELGLASQK